MHLIACCCLHPLLSYQWTAPEALCYDAFSTKSDVWSFGIVLWEIATFGEVPYPELEARDVLHKLEEGYRMPEPLNCPAGLHDVRLGSVAAENRSDTHFHSETA